MSTSAGRTAASAARSLPNRKFVQVRGFADNVQIVLAHVSHPRTANQITDKLVELAETERNAGAQLDRTALIGVRV
jgi:hypothetical protein